jgi:hypothetical protein
LTCSRNDKKIPKESDFRKFEKEAKIAEKKKQMSESELKKYNQILKLKEQLRKETGASLEDILLVYKPKEKSPKSKGTPEILDKDQELQCLFFQSLCFNNKIYSKMNLLF